MAPPRFLLREFVVKKILSRLFSTHDETLGSCHPGSSHRPEPFDYAQGKLRRGISPRIGEGLSVTRPAQRFLEVGYGRGDMLPTLSQYATAVDGYDFSQEAFEIAQKKLKSHPSISLLRNPSDQFDHEYDSVFFFEVIGYWKDPVQELKALAQHLTPHGRLIFSFTNKTAQGFAEKETGAMRCFSRVEIEGILKSASLKCDLIWNYGFPLSNFLKPVLHGLYFLKARKASSISTSTAQQQQRVAQSGIVSQSLLARLAYGVFSLIVLPFLYIQMLFKSSDLGTGYVVVASRFHIGSRGNLWSEEEFPRPESV